MSDSSQPHGLQSIRLLHPWDFPGKSTGVGCHGKHECRRKVLHISHLMNFLIGPIPLSAPDSITLLGLISFQKFFLISYCSFAPSSLAYAADRNFSYLITFLFYNFLPDHVLGKGFIFHSKLDSLDYFSKKNLSPSYKLHAPVSVGKKPTCRIFCTIATLLSLKLIVKT